MKEEIKIKLIKQAYEKKYGSQRYEDSILHHTFEDVILNAITNALILVKNQKP